MRIGERGLDCETKMVGMHKHSNISLFISATLNRHRSISARVTVNELIDLVDKV